MGSLHWIGGTKWRKQSVLTIHPSGPRRALSPPSRCIDILLVEDHADTARALTLLLGRDGYKVRTAGSVVEGIQAAERASFDLLICDLQLPDGTCVDVMRELRATLGKDVLGIALSGHDSEEHRAETLSAGFVEHLVKPLSFEALEAAILRVCGAAKQ